MRVGGNGGAGGPAEGIKAVDGGVAEGEGLRGGQRDVAATRVLGVVCVAHGEGGYDVVGAEKC